MMRLALMIVLMLPLTVGAGGYRWTDEDGNVHFSDKPPPNAAKAEEVEIEGPEPIGQGESVQRTRRELEKMREEREKRERKADRKRALRERQRQRECRRKADLLSKMKNNRVQYKQPDGTYRGVDQETHHARMDRLEQWLEDNCNR